MKTDYPFHCPNFAKMKKKIFQINIEKNGPIAGLKWSRARDNVRYVSMQEEAQNSWKWPSSNFSSKSSQRLS